MKPTGEATWDGPEGLTDEQQRRLSTILDEYFVALEHGAPARERLLEQHPDLAPALEEYFESLEFLQQAAAGFHPVEIRLEEGAALQRLGDFEIVSEIGRGGMGIVYEAWQQSLGRRVALKVLPFASLLDSKQIARFRNEAQAAAQLHHPHIVPVFAVGSEGGVHYYAMQLIDGLPLDDVIAVVGAKRSTAASGEPDVGENAVGENDAGERARGAAEQLRALHGADPAGYFRRVAQLGAEAADALAAAHRDGIVHRDVKPSNLLLDRRGSLWVTDFGLARVRDNDQLTQTGDFIGTMRYMSPEQARGDSQWLDHRTDVYSLGVTLYELATLHRAVRGDTPAEVLRQIERGRPYGARMWDPSLPRDLENVLRKAMAKDADDRYRSCDELADDLRRVVEGVPTLARRPTVAQRLTRWTRRHGLAVAAALLLLAAIAAGLGVSNLRLARQKSKTEAALQEVRGKDRDYRRQLAESKHRLALLHRQAGNSDLAELQLAEAERMLRRILEEAPQDTAAMSQLAATLNNRALLLDDRAALAQLNEAVTIQQRLARLQPDRVGRRCELATAFGNIGSRHAAAGRWQRAAEQHQRAVDALQSALQSPRREPRVQRDLGVALSNRGRAEQALGQPQQALASYRAALEQLHQAPQQSATDFSRLGGVYQNLAAAEQASRQLEEAAENLRRAVDAQAKAVQMAPQVPAYQQLLRRHLSQLTDTLAALGRVPEAADAAQQLRELRAAGDPTLHSTASQ